MSNSKTLPCPQCRKKGEDTAGDNLVEHTTHGYRKCFKCGYYESINGIIANGQYLDIVDRGLSKATCEKFGIQIASYTGKFFVNKQPMDATDERCVVFNTYNKSKIVKQKIRSMANKKCMKLLGDTHNTTLFGKHAFSPHKKIPVVITEGEFDAASVWQAADIPAVSLPNGAGGVGCLLQELEWLQGFKHIVLMFDQDEAGQEAVEKALMILPVGRVRIATLPYKDANEMLQKGKAADIKSCIWNAEIRRPTSIVTVADIIHDITTKPTMGLSTPWDFLNEGMYGFQPNHIYVLAGAAQVGKTEFLREIIFHLIHEVKTTVGLFSLEQGASSTIQRLVGSIVKKRLHIPSEQWWDEDKITECAMTLNNKIFLYRNDSNESLDLENFLINVRYMHFCYGINIIVLDNLTAMCHTPIIDGKYVGKYQYIGHIMNKLFALSRELPLSIIIVSHLSNDTVKQQVHFGTSFESRQSHENMSAEELEKMVNRPGLDWNSGRMPGLGSLDGSDVVAKLADYVIGLARNTVSRNDVIRRTLKVKFLKTRLDSEHCGKEFRLLYDYETGRYEA